MERSDDDRAIAAPLTITVGGQPRELRVLSRRESRPWKKLVAVHTGEIVASAQDVEAALARGGDAAMVDELLESLVLAYDADGVLGGADGLADMTDRELAAAYDAIAAETFPKGEDGIASLMRTFGVVPSLQPSSTNGRSPDGDSPTSASTRTRTGKSS